MSTHLEAACAYCLRVQSERQVNQPASSKRLLFDACYLQRAV